MTGTFAPPAGPPPTTAPNQPRRQETQDELQLPDEPPPAYSAVASHSGDTTLAAGPARPDFSGPPPMPDRLESNITGVGVGYGSRIQGVSPQPTGGSLQGNNPFGDHQAPPQHPSRPSSQFAALSGPPPSSPAGPSRPPPPTDLSPTEVPTPGRPLLRHGQLLVYPKGHFCHKCGNTGYKANDPSNPHDADWRKYGKPYNAALAASFATSTGPNANPSVISSSNFQKPLPNFAHPPPQHQQSFNHLPPPPPGKWNTYPGQHAGPPQHHHHPLPHPQQPYHGGFGQQQHYGLRPGQVVGMPPPGAIVVQPGDPRIGGRPCWNCGGSGREISFFGFDDGKCYQCRGIGRVF